MARVSWPPFAERLLVAVFVVAIAAPLLGTLTGRADVATEEENREAAPWPALPGDRASAAAWPDAFTRAFADRFAFRRALVRAQARLRVEGLRSSPTGDVWLGRDGWLYYGTDGAVEDVTGTRPFSAEELEAWRDTLEHTHAWLARRGIRYVFVVAPDKHWTYADALPSGLRRASASRVDQLLGYLAAHTTVPVVDLRPTLREAASRGRVFHRTDTHWNDVGAFAAYRALMAQVGPPLGLHAPAETDMDPHVVTRADLDLARMLGLAGVMHEVDVQLDPRAGRRARVIEPADAARGLMYPRVVTAGPATGPRALVFRDSFFSAVIPFLSEHFSRAVYVWQNNFDPALVIDERPNVVIQEWVTRHLYTAAPYDAVAEQERMLSSSAPARR